MGEVENLRSPEPTGTHRPNLCLQLYSVAPLPGGARLDKLLGQVHDLLPDPTLPDGVGVVVGPTKPATRHTLAQPRASLPSPSLSVLSEFRGSLACDAAHTSTAARLTAVALALGSLTLTRCRHTTRPPFPKRATQRHTHASCTGYSLCLSRRAQLPLSSH